MGLVSVNLLHLVLRVQLHILGRCSYQQEGNEGGDESLTLEVRGAFLSLTYSYMLGDGLKAMSAAARAASTEVLAETGLTSKLDCADTAALLAGIRARLEAGQGGGTADEQSPLLLFILAPGALLKDASAATQAMLDETWDVVESPAFSAALGAALDKSASVLGDQLQRSVFAAPVATGPASPVPASPVPASTSTALPLPRLLVQLKPSRTVLLVEEGRSPHGDATSSLPEVQDLAGAIFGSTKEGNAV